MACAITAKKLCIPVAHIEAGLRSRDWTMPEEINRILTDAISDFLFTPSKDADSNLLREGISSERIHLVGNVMIDCLLTQLPKTEKRDALDRLNLKAKDYAVLTLHRPSNVDNPDVFQSIMLHWSKYHTTSRLCGRFIPGLEAGWKLSVCWTG
jgi:UDP-N-acetylglucosamine 2-epimerase (non-hydrolysing)